jgi:hypothetical protein
MHGPESKPVQPDGPCGVDWEAGAEPGTRGPQQHEAPRHLEAHLQSWPWALA